VTLQGFLFSCTTRIQRCGTEFGGNFQFHVMVNVFIRDNSLTRLLFEDTIYIYLHDNI
jgi:hypothetical protein